MKTKLLWAALSVVLLSWPKTAAATCSTFGGRATVVQANALGIGPVVLSDTGNLDSTGGAKQASLPNGSVPSLVSGEVLHATAIGVGSSSQSEASVAHLNLTVAGNTIGADFIMARAKAYCGSGVTTASGSSELDRLVVNGQSIVVTGLPNQTLSLPGGAVIILNEQTSSVQDPNANITVNALHLRVPGVADAVIASAFADPTPLQDLVIGGPCPNGFPCPCPDFVTGGGWITPVYTGATGDNANFGVGGGFQNGAPWGHLEYIDHAVSPGMNVHGTGVTNCMATGPTSREITGSAEVNGVDGYSYTVDVADTGEPGQGVDTFVITVTNGYNSCDPSFGCSSPETLGGGNIQLHN